MPVIVSTPTPVRCTLRRAASHLIPKLAADNPRLLCKAVGKLHVRPHPFLLRPASIVPEAILVDIATAPDAIRNMVVENDHQANLSAGFDHVIEDFQCSLALHLWIRCKKLAL